MARPFRPSAAAVTKRHLSSPHPIIGRRSRKDAARLRTVARFATDFAFTDKSYIFRIKEKNETNFRYRLLAALASFSSSDRARAKRR